MKVSRVIFSVIALLFLIFHIFPALAEDKDFQEAIRASGIEGAGIEGSLESGGKIRITKGSLASVPTNIEVLIDGDIEIAGTRIGGQGYYKNGELVNAAGSSILQISRIMTDITILKDGGFIVKTKSQEITLTGGSIEGTAAGLKIIADDRIIELGKGISIIDARGKDIFIDGKEIIFNGVWPKRIERINDNGDIRYFINVFGRQYAASGGGIEFTLDRIIIPQSSQVIQDEIAITAKKGALEWHFSKNQFDISTKNAVFIEKGTVTGKVISGGEIFISTPKGEHILQNNGKETIKSNARLDAMLQISARISEIEPEKIREGRFSFEAFQLQQWLMEAGYYEDRLDGMPGTKTKEALNKYFAERGIEPINDLNDNDVFRERLRKAAEMNKVSEYIVVLDRKTLPDITFDESALRAGGNVIARNGPPPIEKDEISKLDKKLEESLPRLLRERSNIEAAVEKFFPGYSDDEKILIREHLEAKLIQETVVGAYLARINNEMIPSRATLVDNRKFLSEIIKEPLPEDELSKAAFGLGQITLERFVDVLGKDKSLQQMTGITSPSISALYGNRDKQLEYANKLIDPKINAAVLAVSTRDYLELCNGHIDCEAAVHNAGQGKARFGVNFQSKIRYLRWKVKEINPG